MPSTWISHRSKFRCVTWSLLSKALARTCTVQRSGEPERSNTCSTTPARWHRPFQRQRCLFWTSSAPQCRSPSGQLPTPGHPIIQKMVALLLHGMIWWPVFDLWTLSLKGIKSNVQPDITNQSNYLWYLNCILLGETSTFRWKKRST